MKDHNWYNFEQQSDEYGNSTQGVTRRQYRQRNCLLIQSITEDQKSLTYAVLSLCNNKPGLDLTTADVGQSHCRTSDRSPTAAQPQVGPHLTSWDTPQPIIVIMQVNLQSKAKTKRYESGCGGKSDKNVVRSAVQARHERSRAWHWHGRSACLWTGKRILLIEPDMDSVQTEKIVHKSRYKLHGLLCNPKTHRVKARTNIWR